MISFTAQYPGCAVTVAGEIATEIGTRYTVTFRNEDGSKTVMPCSREAAVRVLSQRDRAGQLLFAAGMSFKRDADARERRPVPTFVSRHRQMYPEQYAHPLCGRRVLVTPIGQPEYEGTVKRVVPSRFGPIAMLDGEIGGWPLDRVRTI